MDSYYEDLIKNIRTLMTENQIQDAYKLMNEELALPYVPAYVEHTLKQLQERENETYQNYDMGNLLYLWHMKNLESNEGTLFSKYFTAIFSPIRPFS